MKRAGTLFAALLLPVSLAQAALLPIDSALGPSTIARDTALGLDWLNLRLTANMSIGEVLAETGLGGRFEGFRYTRSGELSTLYSPFIACTLTNGFCDNYERMLSFIDTIGGNREGFRAPYLLGMTETDLGVPRVYMDSAFFEFFPEPVPRYSFDSQQLAVPYSYRSEFGHFIVRSTQEVPEPGSGLLLAIGALAFTAVRRARKTAALNQ